MLTLTSLIAEPILSFIFVKRDLQTHATVTFSFTVEVLAIDTTSIYSQSPILHSTLLKLRTPSCNIRLCGDPVHDFNQHSGATINLTLLGANHTSRTNPKLQRLRDYSTVDAHSLTRDRLHLVLHSRSGLLLPILHFEPTLHEDRQQRITPYFVTTLKVYLRVPSLEVKHLHINSLSCSNDSQEAPRLKSQT